MTDAVDLTTDDARQVNPLSAPFDVQVRDASGIAQTGQVVTSDLVLVTGATMQAPAVVELPDGVQVLAIRVVGPERDSDGSTVWALECAPGTIPAQDAVEPQLHGFMAASARKPFWCGIFGSRLTSCR